MYVLMYGSEVIISREKERSRIKAVHIDNQRISLDIRSIELCGVKMMMDESFLQ